MTTYEDFTVTVSGKQGDFTVSARGERGLVTLGERCDFSSLDSPALSAALNRIRTGISPGEAQMKAVGAALYAGLFPTPVTDLWNKAQAYAGESGSELRLRLEVISDALAGVPWELLYDPQAALFLMPRLRFSLVRGVARAGVAVRPLKADGAANILRLVANPLDRVSLNAGEEDWLSPLWQGRGTVTTIRAATVQELQAALITERPHILHFDGHGGWDEQRQDGYVVLEDGEGNSSEVSGSQLFTLLDGSTVRMVVLAACKSGQGGAVKQFSGVAQRLMSGAIPSVIAMQYDVPDSAALRFAELFYRALAAQRPVDAAVAEGRKALLAARGESDSAWATPVLFLRAARGELFVAPGREVPFQADGLSQSYVRRPAILAALEKALVAPNGFGKAGVVGLHGAGGYGKTSLARAICHEDAVKAAFPEGILWVELGQTDGMDKQSRELTLVHKLLKWVSDLGGEAANLTDLASAKERLSKVIGDRRCLLVLDNVWSREDAIPFIQGSHTTALLTARKTTIFPRGTARIPVSGMSTDEATELLSYGIAPITPAEAQEFRQLAERLGEYPLLLTLVNRTLEARVELEQSPVSDALAYVRDALEQFGVTAFDDREQAVGAVLSLSLNQLAAHELMRLTELALFPVDTPLPIATALRLWQHTGGLSPVAADTLLSRLGQLSLLLSLDRSPDQQSFQLHDVVRDFLLEPLSGAERQAMHGEIVKALGDWKQWRKTEPYGWRWLAYHLQAGGEEDALFALVTDDAYRAAQREALGDCRAALLDVQRALSDALAANQLARALDLIYIYRATAQTQRISDDMFMALDRHLWNEAITLALYYGVPPRLTNRWTPLLYLQIALESAFAGEWQAAEKAVGAMRQFALPPDYPLRRLQDAFLQRIARALGYVHADGMDSAAWHTRLGAPTHLLAPPTAAAAEADAQLQRSSISVEEFRRRLLRGDAEAISSYDFADEERAAGETSYLSDELVRVAAHPVGQQLIEQTLEAVEFNKYPFYRDIALGALGVAVLAIPDSVRASGLLRRMLGLGLNDSGITFEWELPYQLLALADTQGVEIPWALRNLLGVAPNTRDKWGTFFRARCAEAAARFYSGDVPLARAMLDALAQEPPDSMYAGYGALHLLTLHNRYLEFGFAPPAHLVQQAEMQASHVSDVFTLQPARQRLVQIAANLYMQAAVPGMTELEQLLNSEGDEEVQRFYFDYALSRWLAAGDHVIPAIKRLLPRLLDKHNTTVDLYLARWESLRGEPPSAPELERKLALLAALLTIPPPASGYG